MSQTSPPPVPEMAKAPVFGCEGYKGGKTARVSLIPHEVSLQAERFWQETRTGLALTRNPRSMSPYTE